VRRRLDLVEQGVVDIRGDGYVFVKDQLFSSPSTAGAVVLGGSINGRITWKTATGRTFQQLADEALNDDSPEISLVSPDLSQRVQGLCGGYRPDLRHRATCLLSPPDNSKRLAGRNG
jgi:hypothetical protein